MDDLKKREYGGVPRQTYYTPDGRTLQAIPSMRGYTKDGVDGVRDANLDNGWSLTPFKELQKYCPSCDKWHGTIKEVNQCALKKKKAHEFWENKAKQETKKEPEDLSKRVSSIEESLSEILKFLREKK